MQRLPIMKLDTDRILGVTALIVGVASLAVVVYQTQVDSLQGCVSLGKADPNLRPRPMRVDGGS